MPTPASGDRIIVIRGNYEGFEGVYHGPAGLLSAKVKLDTEHHFRRLRMSSILCPLWPIPLTIPFTY